MSIRNSGGRSGTLLKKETGLPSLPYAVNKDVGSGGLHCPASNVGVSRETLVTDTVNPSPSKSKNHVLKEICKNEAVQFSIFMQVPLPSVAAAL